MADTKYLDPTFAQSLWQQWESFSDICVPLLQSLNDDTTEFLTSGLQGDISGNLTTKQRILFDGIGGFIDHVQMQSYEMKRKLIYAADELCSLDLLLSQGYSGGEK